MSRWRRGVLLLGLALLLGGLAASDVARREAAVARRLAPLIEVVVVRRDLPAGTEVAERHLAVRRIPARYAPVGAAMTAAEVVGGRLAVPVPKGAPVGSALLAAADGSASAPFRRGERPVEVVAAGSPELVVAGTRVDVLVTGDAGTELALQDVEVLAARPAAEGEGAVPGAARVAATLRVTLRQAVELTAAQSFARELRLLPRAPGDRRHATRAVAGGR